MNTNLTLPITLALINFFPALIMEVNADDSKRLTREASYNKLVVAMTKSQEMLNEFSQHSYLSFTREKTDRDGEIESYRFVANDINSGKWKKADTEYSTNHHETKVWESNILFNPESFDVINAKLIKQTDEALLFDMPVSLGVTVDSDDVEADAKTEGIFRAKLKYNKNSNLIQSFEIYSENEFSPQFGVSVDSYSMVNTLRPLASEGPLIIVKQLESVRGSVGYFVSIDEDTEIKNFNFSISKNTPDPN